jgi:putative DNA primase/helicase
MDKSNLLEIGSSLPTDMLSKLEQESWIPPSLAQAAGLRWVDDVEGQEIIGRSSSHGESNAGIVFPYFKPGGSRPNSYRLRRDNPPVEPDKKHPGKFKPRDKYLAPPGGGNKFYFTPGTHPEMLADTALPVVIVEGEKKALALSRLALHEVTSLRFLVIGISGVWNWKGTRGKTQNANGERVSIKGLIPDWDLFPDGAWLNRTVYICFDNDVSENEKVFTARKHLARNLTGYQAIVHFVDIPPGENKGIDDFIVSQGPAAALKLFEDAHRFHQDAIPPGFRVDEEGVWYTPPNPKEDDEKEKPSLWVCAPLHVTGSARCSNGSEWGKVLKWNDPEGREHEWVMPLEMLAGDGTEIRKRLYSAGLNISTNKAARSYLNDYLQAVRPLQMVRSVSRFGWHEGVKSPFETFIIPGVQRRIDGERIVFQSGNELAHNYRISGTLSEWQSKVAALCFRNNRLIFALSVAAAPPLLALTGEYSGGFHIFGSSSTGKTTALLVGGSFWGGGGRLGFGHSWRSTRNGLEAICTLHNDSLLILDELSQLDAKEAATVAYDVANGSGKSRMNRGGGMRDTYKWNLLFLSSGEVDLSAHVKAAGGRNRGGQEVRMVGLQADAGKGLGLFEDCHGMKPSEFAGVLAENSRKYYGTPIAPFLEFVQSHRKEIAEEFPFYKKDFIEQMCPAGNGEISRVAGRFALISYAGELAIKATIFPWPEKTAQQAAETLFQEWMAGQGDGRSDERAALSQVRLFLEQHGASRFQKISKSLEGEAASESAEKIMNRAGFRIQKGEGVEYWIFPTVYAEEICRGFDPKMVSAYLKKLNFLTGEGGRNTLRKHLPELGLKRVYVISGDILDEAPEQPKISSPA